MRVILDIPLSINDVLFAVNAKHASSSDGFIRAICTDTREAEAGDLFIALPGNGNNGESYVDSALKNGCYVLSSNNRSDVFFVDDTVNALLHLAKFYKSILNPQYTVAVTGSVGKSTTVKFISKILGAEYKVHSPIGNFNNHLGVPLTVLSAPRDTEILVLELGMNRQGEIARLSECIAPDMGIITSIGTAHIGNLGSREEIARAKLEILNGMNGGNLILPKSEPLLLGVENALYVSRTSSLSHFYFHRSNIAYVLTSPYGTIENICFFDDREHLLDDLSLAVSAAQAIGMSNVSILKGVRAINENDLRQRFIEIDDFTVFDDSYNSSLESVTADLKYIISFKRPTGAFLGDILELGEMSDSIHEQIGLNAARLGIGHLYLFGRFAQHVAKGAVKGGMKECNIYINTNVSAPELSVEQILKNHARGEIILFKASHKLRFDKIADTIKELKMYE